MKNETMSVMEAARILGIGRVTAYRLAASGVIPAIRLGGKIRVSSRALEKMLECGQTKSEVK